jgi:predicted transcriptional regulator YdeE
LEINNVDNSNNNFVFSTIPADKYAKFVVKGPMQKTVSEFWKNLWNMELPRKFDCNFEEYQNNNPSDAEVHIFILSISFVEFIPPR